MSIFSGNKAPRVKRNKFNLSHERKFTANMGKLTPIMVQEVVPGDKFRVNTEVLMRFAPMLAPVMHRMNVYTHYFFVPNRLLWSEWEDFITGGPDGNSVPVPPFMKWPFSPSASPNDKINDVGSLGDYMGLPYKPTGVGTQDQADISALPFRAYQLIWQEYFRDQNLTAELNLSKLGGEILPANPDYYVLNTLRDRAWEKDYFTSALPWTQRGGDVGVPFEATQINYKPNSYVYRTNGNQGGSTATGPMRTDANQGSLLIGSNSGGTTGGEQGRIENIDSIDGLGVTINDLRRASRLQEWLEKNARGGARYVEQILSHFGVLVPDSRLQRPEFLGGGRVPVSISEVLSNFQFSGDPEGLPQGNMSGHGISVGNQNGFSKQFVEHGFVIGIMSVLPRTAYMQGIPKLFSRMDKFDYLWREFANLGEQEVYNRELYFDTADVSGANNGVFGYQSRYAEYKYSPSTVHGDFKENLEFWTMVRKFSARPNLNEQFVTSDPTQRIFAVTDPDVHKLYVQVYHKFDALRPLPYYGTPKL